GVVQALIHSPIPDEIVWCVLWLAIAIWSQTARNPVAATRPTVGRWRIIQLSSCLGGFCPESQAAAPLV
ncbi:MAG TPA: hypothetical protein VFO15_19660, partial [Xanthobacteraceae bacterium]|nr:hypothetical protein [Xanthobacteraceae bacterium]